MTNYTTDQLLALLDQPTDAGTAGMRIESQRRWAAMELGMSRDPAVVPPLLARLRAETPGCGLHESLTWAAVQHIDTALPEVLAMLTDEDPHLRRTGAHILSKVGDPVHLEALAPLVDDKNADVAIKAYRAVAHAAGQDAGRAAGTLAGRLGHGDAVQRDALTAAFHRLGESAVPALVAALSDPDAEVREHAADSLGHLGVEAAEAAAALESLASDPVASVRLSAVAALGQLGEAASAGLARLTASEDARVAAVARRLAA